MASEFFSSPRVYFGNGSVNVLSRLNNKKVAIVTDEFMLTSGRTAYVTDQMPQATVSIYGKVRPDPGTDILLEGAAQFKAFRPDVIIALGGGSSLDAAKGIRVTLEDHYQQTGGQSKSIELIAIPTTSGSGSEVTSYAIISDPQNGRKYPLVSQALVPDTAILDSELVLSVPRHIAVDTGMDVLTHAIEALVSTGANDFSDALAEKAIAITWQSLPQIYADEKNVAARTHMHNASCMAGMAFNSAGLGLVHGMAHAVGGMLHIAHGKINAMLLPLVIEFNAAHASPETTARYCQCARMIPGIAPAEPQQMISQLVEKIRQLNLQFGIPRTLRELGTDLAVFETMRLSLTETALADGCTASNPYTPCRRDIDQLLSCIAETGEYPAPQFTVPVGISNRHVHLCREDMDVLFGYGSTLTCLKKVRQPGQFAAEETVTLRTPKGEIANVRVLGPLRSTTQIEISVADGFVLGVKAPVRMSGDLENSPGIELVGPKGRVSKSQGTIVAWRHIHISPQEAARYGLREGMEIDLEAQGQRAGILSHVLVRISAGAVLELHIDVEEANGLGLRNGDLVFRSGRGSHL
ncbi:iron-containing alcohol dehydrogenase [Rahnella sp. SL6]|uniref:phosphate propanoyltransferase n=1 Tax=Rahnella perminowiae TaxID=2816244 RepID=UPI002368AA1A|nr:iron-containing alcohol dehydrogenase [Rahnella perminowiae]MBU9810806.1 iron-containing alcohol dehydrogenase [Rahnella perminowiae]